MGALQNLIGRRIGRLTVIGRGERKPGGDLKWICRCDCGNISEVHGWHLRKKKNPTRSCGCLSVEMLRARVTTHGATAEDKRKPSYSVWVGMRDRCRPGSRSGRQNYWSRGITVCERWASYEAFVADMGEPAPGLTLERKDNSMGYRPDNCCWATRAVQSRNTRRNRRITLCGSDMTMADAYTRYGISRAAVAGWAKYYKLSSVEAFYDKLAAKIDPPRIPISQP